MSSFTDHRVGGSSIKVAISVLSTRSVVVNISYQTQDWNSAFFGGDNPTFESHEVSLHITAPSQGLTDEEIDQQVQELMLQFPTASVDSPRINK